ncbi:MAG: hypothetical protein WAR57_05910 [Candidatus Phosphoribacter sp.]
MNRPPDGRLGGSVIAVIGASGGSGTSTLVAACGTRAASLGRSVVLVDGQAGGGGLDVVVGIEHVAGLRWPDLLECRGRVDGSELVQRLPGAAGVRVLSHGRDDAPLPPLTTMTEVLAGLIDAVDLVILDVPRGWASGVVTRGGAAVVASGVDRWQPSAFLAIDLAVLVSGCGVTELAALTATTEVVARRVSGCHIVLRGPARGLSLKADIERALDVPVIAQVRDDPSVSRDLSRGRPPGSRRGPVAEVADRMLALSGMDVGAAGMVS